MTTVNGSTPQETEKALVDLYDDRMYVDWVDEYYGGSGFLNFGYWDGTTRAAAQAGAQLVRELLHMIPNPRGRVLDVACGVGATTACLLDRFDPSNVVGINISHKQLVTCSERLPLSRFAHMDGARLGFADETFDHVICVEAVFHFNTRETFLQEAVRVLKPGGCLVLTDALISPERGSRRRHWNPANQVAGLDDYVALYSRAGFADVEIVNANKECWEGCFWNIVRFVHDKLWNRRITVEQKDEMLERVYRLAEDLEYYVLVRAVKAP